MPGSSELLNVRETVRYQLSEQRVEHEGVRRRFLSLSASCLAH